MKRKIYYLIISLTVFLALANLVASNRLSTAGEGIKRLEKERDCLKTTNAGLEQEIAAISSLSVLSERAGKLGFIRSPKVVYLKGETPVAMR